MTVKIPETLRHLANALSELRLAWESSQDSDVAGLVREAEANTFRAIRQIVDGQIGPGHVRVDKGLNPTDPRMA